MERSLTACPVCRSSLNVPFFDGGLKTLATLGWPSTDQEAVGMPRYPLKYVQCTNCTHIWNQDFEYQNIPYQDNPNRMFNNGEHWKIYL